MLPVRDIYGWGEKWEGRSCELRGSLNQVKEQERLLRILSAVLLRVCAVLPSVLGFYPLENKVNTYAVPYPNTKTFRLCPLSWIYYVEKEVHIIHRIEMTPLVEIEGRYELLPTRVVAEVLQVITFYNLILYL